MENFNFNKHFDFNLSGFTGKNPLVVIRALLCDLKSEIEILKQF